MLSQPRLAAVDQDASALGGAVRVLVVSGIRIYREGLALVLDGAGRIVCVGTAGDARTAAAAARSLLPDVALVDVTTPDALVVIRTMPLGVQTVALGVGRDDPEVVRCAEAGVAGYLTRDDALASVAAAIEAVARGEALCPPEVGDVLRRRVNALGAAPPARGAGDVHLTSREAEIVALIERGLQNKTIAERLCIEVPTVKNHLRNVYEKIGVSCRAEAAEWVRARRAEDSLALRSGRY